MMQLSRSIAATLAGVVALRLVAFTQPPDELPRSTPEEQGVEAPAILAFAEAAEKHLDALHSFMLVRHGHVVAEGWWSPYDAQSRHELYSLSKSFASTAVGLVVDQGRLSLDDTVVSFFPNDLPPEPSANLKAMRVRDLLCMSTGHQAEPPTSPDRVSARSFLAQPVPFKPGTHFLYNTAATFMLSSIVQKVTGQTVLEYLRPGLFEPLGIVEPTWATNFQGVSLGGYGLSVRTEDIAKFGQMYLQEGRWKNRQLLTKAWVKQATSRQASNGSNPQSDWDQGYGFQFWRCRNGAYRGDGAFGQFCLVLPEQDAVLAVTGGLKDMQAVLNLVWAHLLPAMHPSPLAADSKADRQLKDRLSRLVLPPQPGLAASPLLGPAAIKKFVFPDNPQKIESIQLRRNADALTLLVRTDGVEQATPIGYGEWKKGQLLWGASGRQPAAASGAWVKDDAYTVRVCLVETPYLLTLTLRFADDRLYCDAEQNVGFGATKLPQLVGRAE